MLKINKSAKKITAKEKHSLFNKLNQRVFNVIRLKVCKFCGSKS